MWKDIAPMRRFDRLKMNKDNKYCFLDHSDPNKPKYPICPNHTTYPTCQGVNAALKRARMQKNVKIIQKAITVKTNMKCDIVKSKKIKTKKEQIKTEKSKSKSKKEKIKNKKKSETRILMRQ